jgi:predicted DCC family thiol-disulfide oxidoreductase YuxK
MNSMAIQPEFPLRIFYDGSCVVCAGEVEHYLRLDRAGRLAGVDISSPDFDPAPYRISREAFMFELHVIDRAGTIYRGVDSFRAIWRAFPASTLFGMLGTLVGLPLVLPVARIAYRCFARVRPYLPKRHDCKDGTCRIDRKH